MFQKPTPRHCYFLRLGARCVHPIYGMDEAVQAVLDEKSIHILQ